MFLFFASMIPYSRTFSSVVMRSVADSVSLVLQLQLEHCAEMPFTTPFSTVISYPIFTGSTA